MTVTFICLAVSFLVLIPVLLGGIFGGMRKGAYRAGAKLAALVLSIVVSLIITLFLRGALSGLLSAILKNALPEALREQSSIVDLGAEIAAASALLVAFWLIFTIVRLLMLIPQKIIIHKLPQKYEELHSPKIAVSTDAPLQESECPPAEPAPSAEQSALSKHFDSKKVLWNTAAAVCGALSSLLLLSVMLMPISGIVTRSGTAIYQITRVLADEGYGEYADEISEYAYSISTAPLFSVTDFLTGKTIFEPLTTVPTEFGTISLTKEMKIATDVLCQALPAAIHVTDSGTLNKEDAENLANAVHSVIQSDFMLSVGTWGAGIAGEKLKESADSKQSVSRQALQEELSDILTDMTPETLAEDLETLADLSEVLAESTVLKVLSSDNKSPDPADLTDRETMRESFGILYDNDHTKNLLVPLINLGTESVFKSIGAEPVYSNTDINDLSREQVLDESDRLCDVADNISTFTKSMEGEDKKLGDYEMVSAGKALDIMKDSVLFGDQYEEVVKSVTSANANNQNSELMESLGDAIVESDSAEKLMNSAQSMVDMSDALENTTDKGRENEKLVSSLDVLLNDTTPKDANSLSGIAGEHFLSDRDNLDSDTKKQMLEDSMKALTAVCAEGSEDVEAEADAVQTFNDLSNAKTTNIFEGIGEKKAVDDFLASKLAMEMLKNLNAENRDYDIRAKLSEENKTNISAALAASNADAASKLVVGQFFGVN